ncbi:MAG TPA: sensor histidine kinase [Chitinophagaceae bacterium]|nr:sensor histidine kinase [Chitinophagaceae bacterium]
MRTVIDKKSSDNITLPLYYDIAKQYYLIGKQDSGLIYLKKGLAVAELTKNKEWYCKIGLRIGLFYALMSDADSANKYLEVAEPYKMGILNDTILAYYNNHKAIVAINQEDYEAGASYTIKTLEILEKMGDKKIAGAMIQNTVNLIVCLKDQKQFQLAEKYLKKTLENIDYTKEKPQLDLLYFNAAALYLESKDTLMFKQYLDSALFYNKQFKSYVLEMNIKASYAEYYFITKNYKESYKHYLEVYTSFKQQNQINFIPAVAIGVAQALPFLGNWEAAIPYYQEAIELAKKDRAYRILTKAYDHLNKLYSKNMQFEKAYEYGQLQLQYQDSVSNIASKKNLQLLEAKYQNEKKEKEIATLTLSNTQKELTVLRRNRLLAIGGIASTALLIVLGLFNRQNKQKRTIAEKDKILQQEQIKFLERQQQVVSLQSMVNGQETERTRIAKDLHDGLGGLFSTIKMHFSSLQHENENLKTNPLFSKSYDMVNTASEEVRRIAHNMMPEVLIKLGLVQASKELCNSISAGKLLQASLQSYGMEKRLNASTEIMLFRIIQELLNNIIKHANATEAIIQFNRDSNRLSVTVEDNGRGFNLKETDAQTHAGLESVQNRVTYLNGKLSIESEKEIGTTVMMDFLINE